VHSKISHLKIGEGRVRRLENDILKCTPTNNKIIPNTLKILLIFNISPFCKQLSKYAKQEKYFLDIPIDNGVNGI
jgi:hypothetical protein